MEKEARQEQILEMIERAQQPISATAIAKEFGVSRQVVVGDVALLRSSGAEIIATARGYTIPINQSKKYYYGKIACCHDPKDTKSELYAIVDLEAIVVDVVVEHEVYGEITGQLNLKTRLDVDEFQKKIDADEIKLLSELTNGIHLHTIACNDKTHFLKVKEELSIMGYLLNNN